MNDKEKERRKREEARRLGIAYTPTQPYSHYESSTSWSSSDSCSGTSGGGGSSSSDGGSCGGD